MTEKPVPAVVMMGAKEARAETDAAKTDIVRGLGRLARVRDREGWRSLEYETWDAFCLAELGWTRNYTNKVIDHEQFRGEIEAAVGTTVPTLTERGTRPARSKHRAETVAEVREATADLPVEERPAAAKEVVDRKARTSKKERPTSNFESQEFKVNLADPERQTLIDLAVAAGEPSDATLTKLARAALGHDGWDDWPIRRLLTPAQVIAVADLASSAGLNPARFVAKTIADLLETGEVPTLPKANGRRRTPIRAPAMDAALAERQAKTVQRLRVNVAQNLRRGEVAPNFKGGKK